MRKKHRKHVSFFTVLFLLLICVSAWSVNVDYGAIHPGQTRSGEINGICISETGIDQEAPMPPIIELPGVSENYYVEFPALVFESCSKESVSGKLCMTFEGIWHNLAPQPVSYSVSAEVMRRKGEDAPIFEVTDINTSSTLSLGVGTTATFSLTVEAPEPVVDKYSELIVLHLFSQDVTNLWKPYLMCASNGYLDVSDEKQITYKYSYTNYTMAAAPGTSPEDFLPKRETLGYHNGVWERDLTEAFEYALVNALEPVKSRHYESYGFFNFTDWAVAGMPDTWYREWPESARTEEESRLEFSIYRNHPLTRLLSGMGQYKVRTLPPVPSEGAVINELKQTMLLLSDELPFYPLICNRPLEHRPQARWDRPNPAWFPHMQIERPGAEIIASYIELAQFNAMTDEEHFRFLHNVILPHYLIFNESFRMNGRLSSPANAGDYELSVTGNPPSQREDWSYVIGIEAFARVGSGENIEYIQLVLPKEPGSTLTIKPGQPSPGGLKYDHASGEPWHYVHVSEWLELSGADIWSFLYIAVASRDAAVVEQIVSFIKDIYATQKFFREDGSFANEPGSYGWLYQYYIKALNEMEIFLAEDFIQAGDSLYTTIIDCLEMWNAIPFSNGRHTNLNRGGAYGPYPRQEDLDCLKQFAPEETELINKFENIICQEENRTPGSMVDNWSFKIDGWGYSMLRGPGSWDNRMETLLSSKNLLYNPGDHVSWDCLGFCLYSHGVIMTPRYGYYWIGYPDFLLNCGRIDSPTTETSTQEIWGDFLHFDDNSIMPSAIAYTDMCGPYSTDPGIARQERWCIQLPEYLFDAYFFKTRDETSHLFQ